MSRTPESTAPPAAVDQAKNTNSLGVSIALFLLVFTLFIAGLYVMSLMTPLLFTVGLLINLLSLFITFTIIPKYLT